MSNRGVGIGKTIATITKITKNTAIKTVLFFIAFIGSILNE